MNPFRFERSMYKKAIEKSGTPQKVQTNLSKPSAYELLRKARLFSDPVSEIQPYSKAY
jgi:hypothetical protein